MSGTQLLQRVRHWFGRGNAEAATQHADPCPAATGDTGRALLLVASGTGATASRASPVARPALHSAERSAPTVLSLHDPTPSRTADPGDRRPADATMADIAGELHGHRETARAIAHSVERLPDLALSQVDLLRRGNQLLERDVHVSEGVLDELAALRGAFRGVEESSRRQLRCFTEIESNHREVLAEYQDLLIREHRRLYRMTLAAVLLAAAAFGGVLYVLATGIGR
jgi:hypothetical protein